jgi:hypothetical protein
LKRESLKPWLAEKRREEKDKSPRETLFESSINMVQSNFYVLTYLDLPGSLLRVSSIEVIMIESLLPCAG